MISKEDNEDMFETPIDNEIEPRGNFKKKVIILSISLGLLVAIIVAIILFLLLKNKDDNENDDTTEVRKLLSFDKYETPYYFYNTTLLEETISSCLKKANQHNIKIHFSLKSNFNEKILKIISSHKEIGADCVSGGEVELALKYFPPEDIVFAGIGKTDKEIEAAVDKNIFCLNIESLEELETLNEICKRKKKKMKFATRINPNVLAHTHEKITTGLNENKFGIFLDKDADKFYNKIKDVYFNTDNNYEYLNFIGLHFHIGSQILNLTDYLPLCKKIDEIIANLTKLGVNISYLNLGGGLGVDYDAPNENPIPDFEGFFDVYLNNIKSLQMVSENFNGNQKINLHFELGRSLICQSGNLIARVNYIKQGIEKKFLILDAGMNDLIRPAMYGALHQIERIGGDNDEEEMYDVVGPICESSDVFAKNYTMKKCKKGDLVMIRSAGAYGESMASRYNYRKIPEGYLDTDL